MGVECLALRKKHKSGFFLSTNWILKWSWLQHLPSLPPSQMHVEFFSLESKKRRVWFFVWSSSSLSSGSSSFFTGEIALLALVAVCVWLLSSFLFCLLACLCEKKEIRFYCLCVRESKGENGISHIEMQWGQGSGGGIEWSLLTHWYCVSGENKFDEKYWNNLVNTFTFS